MATRTVNRRVRNIRTSPGREMKFRVLRSKDYLCSLEIAYRYVVTLIELKGGWYWDGFEKKVLKRVTVLGYRAEQMNFSGLSSPGTSGWKREKDFEIRKLRGRYVSLVLLELPRGVWLRTFR